jgi:hypothetical protein
LTVEPFKPEFLDLIASLHEGILQVGYEQ